MSLGTELIEAYRASNQRNDAAATTADPDSQANAKQ